MLCLANGKRVPILVDSDLGPILASKVLDSNALHIALYFGATSRLNGPKGRSPLLQVASSGT